MLRCQWKSRVTVGRMLGAGTLLLLSSPVSAEPSGPAAWDERHMQSNLTQERTALAARPILIGTASTSTTIGVAEQVLTISPHGWQPGGPRSFATSTARSSGGADFSRPLSMSGVRNSASNNNTRSQRHSHAR